ncbi:MAG TPA: ABC transporter substrate-binding protein [Candidatus Sulfotelmatobacter sp.]|nr:ABC transporter substrate-binding protein [Candidatus Sulfotelmatobacter sp.]
MQFKRIKLRYRRGLKKNQKRLDAQLSSGEDFIEKNLYGRLHKLKPVRRFVLAWVGLVVLLILLVGAQDISLSGYYQTLSTIPGGIYSEGVPGYFTNSNPIYAQSDANLTISRLIFGSLFTTNNQGQLVGELASNYVVSDQGRIYTVNLKPNLYWQDGQPLTSQDVVFTVDTIENTAADSPLYANWSGISASAPNSTTVVFSLPNVLASFPQNLTVGIIPKHILASIPPDSLRSANFNTISPVGAGPFAMQAVQVKNGDNINEEQVELELKPNPGYVLGEPKLDKFIVNVYADQNQMFADFKSKYLTGMETTDLPPKNITNAGSIVEHSIILRAETMVFFKTSSGILSSQGVRNALVAGTNVPAIVDSLGYPTVEVNEPFLKSQYTYNPNYAQSSYNPATAVNLLNANGWTTIKNGIRYSGNQPLSFTLTAANTYENRLVTNQLKQQWGRLGVLLNVQLLSSSDFATTLSFHQYDAALTSITIGTDPDVYVYWSSTQANATGSDNYNFSEFQDPVADQSLQAGRVSLSPALRAVNYGPFLQEWQAKSPALGLYQPRLLYLTNGPVNGLDANVLNSPVDRLNNVQNWEIRQAKVTDN